MSWLLDRAPWSRGNALFHHLGRKLFFAGAAALATQLANHNPLLAVGLGLAAVVVATILDELAERRRAAHAAHAAPAT